MFLGRIGASAVDGAPLRERSESNQWAPKLWREGMERPAWLRADYDGAYRSPVCHTQSSSAIDHIAAGKRGNL